MEGFIEWLKNHFLTCPSKHFLHIDCPGCGMQRSIVALLEGNFTESIRLYPATVPMFLCLLFLVLHLKFKFKYGPEVIKITFIIISLIVVIFYIHKIFTYQLI